MKDTGSVFQKKKRQIYTFAPNARVCRDLLRGGAKIIQFRNKELDDHDFYNEGEKMLSLVKERPGAVLIINDRVDIALALSAHGVHVGQDDENIQEVRLRVPKNFIVGVSARTVEKAMLAREKGADYVGTGSVFPTETKKDAVVIGLSGLSQIVREVNIPVVAIGGINTDNIGEVVKTGCPFFAVLSQINNADFIPEKVREFTRIINEPPT